MLDFLFLSFTFYFTFSFTFQFKWYRRAIFKWKMDMLKMMIVPTQDCNSHVWFSCKLKEKEKIKIFRIIHFENWANSFHRYQYNIQMLRIKLCLLFLWFLSIFSPFSGSVSLLILLFYIIRMKFRLFLYERLIIRISSNKSIFV